MPLGLYYPQSQGWDDPNGYMADRDNSGKDFQKYLDEKCKPRFRELLENSETVCGTKTVGPYPYETPGLEMTRRDSRLYLHVLTPRIRIELPNIANQLTGAFLVKDARPLSFKAEKTCEGDSMIEVEIPEEMQADKNYCVCLMFSEKEPVFEPIRD